MLTGNSANRRAKTPVNKVVGEEVFDVGRTSCYQILLSILHSVGILKSLMVSCWQATLKFYRF